MLQKLRGNTQGFTLIELMIVIAIIGILAAIAIPNFIAYRNKAFCSAAESDAKSTAAAIADYFAIPSHTRVARADLTSVVPSGNNTIAVAANDPSQNITILVTDGSGRCPANYKAASTWWQGDVFTELMRQ